VSGSGLSGAQVATPGQEGLDGTPRPRVLVLARNFPNPELPTLGIWTERMVRASREVAEPTVVAPVPYVPVFLRSDDFSRFRRIPRERDAGGIPVFHPRVPVGPGYSLHAVEADLAYPFLRRLVDRLHRQRPFDLIHAHFIYPDGVLAARLGRRYGLPVVTTEHAPWLPWFGRHPRVRRLVASALPRIQVVSVVSERLRDTVIGAMGRDILTELIPNVVDTDTFVPREDGEQADPNQILFVGVVRHVKGLDILVRALARLAHRVPDVKLRVVGAPFYRGYARDADQVRALIHALGLSSRVDFTGQASPTEVAEAMRQSAVLVVPSRSEMFPTVILEALASGTPVVATRCGGPEEILTPATGRLVPTEDPAALADAIEDVLAAPHAFDAVTLHEYAASRYGPAATRERFRRLYSLALEGERAAV
jgi:teichuronic acid biosynthesis glycosyltransferase TuaC